MDLIAIAHRPTVRIELVERAHHIVLMGQTESMPHLVQSHQSRVDIERIHRQWRVGRVLPVQKTENAGGIVDIRIE